MDAAIVTLIVLVIAFHVNAFVLESLLWLRPSTMKTFGTTPETAAASHTLAINQGVYNLFLAAGLIGSLLTDDPIRFAAQAFFLSCVIVAALTAGFTVSKKIMLLQGLPALTALILVIANH